MKLRVDSKPFAEAVAWLVSAVDPKMAQYLAPEQAGIALSADNDLLTLRARDHQTSVVIVLSAVVDDPGTVAIPQARFARAVKELDGAVELKLSGTTLHLTGRRSYRFQVLPEGDRGGLEVVDDLDPATGLARLLDGADKFASRDDQSGPCAGIHLVAESGQLRIEATDRYHLLTRIADGYAGPALDVVLPAPTAALVASAEVHKLRGDPAILVDPLRFAWADRVLAPTVLEGRFPSFAPLVDAPAKQPDEDRATAATSADLLAELKALTPITETVLGVGSYVDVGFDDDVVTLAGSAAEEGEGDTAVMAEVPEKARDLDLRFNAGYLRDCIQAARSDQVRLVPAVETPNAKGIGVFWVLGDEKDSRALLSTVERPR